MSTAILPDFFADIDTCIATLPIKPPANRPMTQDEFFDFCQQNRKLRFERTSQGELILNPAAGGLTGMQILAVAVQLHGWTKGAKAGAAFGSSVGYILPNGANRSPDASWISPGQLAAITPEQMKKFLSVCPYFLIELLSPTHSLKKTIEKMEEYIVNGCQLGWLIDPDTKQVHVYRPGQPVQVLDNPQTVSGDPELPGFVLDLDPVWRP